MSDVPSNLIPTRLTQLPVAPVADENSLMMIVYQGNNYQIRVGDLLSVSGVPLTRQVIAGTGMTGGGALSSNVTLSIANGGVGSVQLANSGVTSGVYGNATNIPVLTVDNTGRVTAATTVPASISGYVPTSTQVIAGNGLTGGGALSGNVTLAASYSASAPQAGFQTGSAGVANTIARSDHKHPAVDLSADDQVDNILGLGNGGTARSIVPAAGAVVWSGSDGLYVTAVGSAGQVLVSGGASSPTWGSALIVSDQPANYVYAGPTAGGSAPTSFRLLVNADIPTTLTGKSISGATNTLTDIANASLTNSSITINGSAVSLGGSVTVTATASNALTIGTGLSGTSYNGSAPVTIAIDSTVATLTGSQTLTNKTISGASNTLTNIANASLTNSSVTVGTTAIALGASSLTLGGLTSVAVTQDPTSALQLATKQYVDAVAEGLHVHASCAAATTGTLASITGGTVTYNNGTAGVGATLTLSVALTTLDGYTLLNGDRVLVKNEATQANNGIYTWATGGTVLTRATDFDTAVEMASGDFTFITNGTLYANTGWVQTDPVTTVGSSPVVWVQFSGAGTYTAGTGLTLAGSQFSITNTAVTAASYGSASKTLTVTVNAQGQLTALADTNIAIANTQVSGLGTMSTQNATSVAITGGAIDGTTIGGTTAAAVTGTTVTASTKFSGSNYDASGSGGGSLRTSSGAACLQWGGGGGVNLTLDGPFNMNPANATISIAPTGTGTLTVNPATAGTINNMVIGGTTAAAITGTTITGTAFVGISGGTF